MAEGVYPQGRRQQDRESAPAGGGGSTSQPQRLGVSTHAAAAGSMQPPTLPCNLWPHDFLTISVILATVFGILDFLTLPLTGIAIFLATISRSQSKAGDYEVAKNFSNKVVAVLSAAILQFCFSIFIPSIVMAGIVGDRR